MDVFPLLQISGFAGFLLSTVYKNMYSFGHYGNLGIYNTVMFGKLYENN